MIYHMQIMEGDLVNTLRENLNRFRAYIIADTQDGMNQAREDFPYIFEAIDDMGWEGYYRLNITRRAAQNTLSWMPE